jgi:hypothetical protein
LNFYFDGAPGSLDKELKYALSTRLVTILWKRAVNPGESDITGKPFFRFSIHMVSKNPCIVPYFSTAFSTRFLQSDWAWIQFRNSKALINSH